MKKKVKMTTKKRPRISTKKMGKKNMNTTIQKVIVGEDEFCPTCMEWRAYDEATGKCKVCGRQIKKAGVHSRMITEEYDLKDFTVEHDEQQDTEEN
jgi:predicted amidophosphoribosyltransferase